MIGTLEVAQGTKPIKKKIDADKMRPTERKTRGLERSETAPMRNFEKP